MMIIWKEDLSLTISTFNRIAALGLVLVLQAPLASPVWAASGLTDEAQEAIQSRANEAAARALGLPLERIQAGRKAGFDLFMVLIQAEIAKRSGMALEDVIQGRLQGYSWGEMAQAWNFSMEDVVQAVGVALKELRRQGVEIPAPSAEEVRRSVGTGTRTLPLKAKP